MARPLRNEDAGAVCHVMNGVGDVAMLKSPLQREKLAMFNAEPHF
jgi:hypothetical protein